MSFLSEEMKAQLMKVVGVDAAQFETMLEEHAPQLTQCSDKLAKSSPFDIQLILFKNLIETEGLDKISRLANLPEKLKYVFKVLSADSEFRNIQNILPNKKEVKNSGDWKQSKELGNEQFQKRNFGDAIRSYNASLLAGSLDKKSEAALSLGNRSVVHFSQKAYARCIHDCQAALLFGYPAELEHKIHERKARAHSHLGQNCDARKGFEQALSSLKTSKLSEEKRNIIKDEIEDTLKELPQEDEMVVALRDDRLLIITKPHHQFPCLSSSVEMKYNPKVGRHAIATKNIKPGELILMESPVSLTMNPEMSKKICVRCFKQAGDQMVPCPERASGVFCSLPCYLQAKSGQDNPPTALKEEDHRLLDLFSVGLDSSGTTLLALWAVKSEPLEFFLKNENELFGDIRPDIGVNEPKEWKLEGKQMRYKSLFNLVSHMDQLTIDMEVKYLITTTVLIRFLQEFGYFSSKADPAFSGELGAEELLIGRLLFQFHCGIRYNQHGIYTTGSKVEAGKNLPLLDIGIAVYPTLLFINHSCAPNTFRINHGQKMYMVAKRDILAGEEVTDCYGIHHLSLSREERQSRLSTSFSFDCVCQACEANWPDFPHLESGMSQGDMGRLGNHLSTYTKLFKAGEYQDACDQCQTYLQKLAKINIELPHRNHEIGGLALQSCFWAMLHQQ